MMNFVERYGAMSDGELEQIAESMDDLTDEAKQALRAEMTRRGLEIPENGPGEWVSQEQVVIAQFLDLHEALLAKGQLESAGIACALRDDNMVRIDWFISNLLGGVKLTVAPADVEAAKALLAEPLPEDFDVGEVEE